MKNALDVIKVIIVGIVVAIIVALIMGYPIMWLWNFLMPDIFGLPPITILQAIALLVFFSLLFKASLTNSNS